MGGPQRPGKTGSVGDQSRQFGFVGDGERDVCAPTAIDWPAIGLHGEVTVREKPDVECGQCECFTASSVRPAERLRDRDIDRQSAYFQVATHGPIMAREVPQPGTWSRSSQRLVAHAPLPRHAVAQREPVHRSTALTWRAVAAEGGRGSPARGSSLRTATAFDLAAAAGDVLAAVTERRTTFRRRREPAAGRRPHQRDPAGGAGHLRPRRRPEPTPAGRRAARACFGRIVEVTSGRVQPARRNGFTKPAPGQPWPPRHPGNRRQITPATQPSQFSPAHTVMTESPACTGHARTCSG